MKLIVNNLEFHLTEVPNSRFLLTQIEPYPMQHILYSKWVRPADKIDKVGKFKTYIYKSIIIDGKFYAFKLADE